MADIASLTRPAIAHGDALPERHAAGRIAEALLGAVATYPAGRFVHIDADGRETRQSFADTLSRARRILGGLRRHGVRPGDGVILHLARCEDFVAAIWAALLGGAVIVPLARRDRSRHHAQTAAETLRRLQAALPSPWLLTDSVPDSARALSLAALETEAPAEPAIFGTRDDPRLLVLTSGTTLHPRLVALSERAAMHRWWPDMPAADAAVSFLSWSPFDHVMGLGIASPNLPQKISLAPERFAASPLAWLDTVQDFGVTHATMTNSGMAMILRALAEAPGRCWDLTGLRKLGIGAEAISPRLCARFAASLAAFGLRPDAMILGYGLSECGPVAGGSDSFVPCDSGPFVPLDRPTRGHAVRIVDASGVLRDEGEIGAVQVRGPTMTLGYHGDEAATAALFTADGWVRTGDLGLLSGGRLTITGREKEQIVIHARKYACVEIEAVAETVPAVEAAYAVARRDDASFALFLVLVPRCDASAAAAQARAAVAARVGLAPASVVPIAADAVPRTASGKVQRLELAARLDAGLFDDARDTACSANPPRTPRERRIAAIWADILGFDGFGIDDDFFTIGGDSIAAVRMVQSLETAFAIRLPADTLHRHTTIARLTEILDAPQGATAPDVADRQRALTRGWGGETVVADGLLRGFNRGGRNAPWFWCLQLAGEAQQLAHHLGADQPLYAMRSGHLVMPYTPEATAALARRYVQEILAVDPTGPYWLGGLCQGCIVMREIALQLQQSGRAVVLLALIDTAFWELFDGQVYTGPVACLSATGSRFNPLRRFRTPEAGWRKLLPSVRFTLLPGDHGHQFTPATAPALVAALRAAADWAAFPLAPTSATGAMPDSAYAAAFSAPTDIVLAPGEQRQLTIGVRNAATAAWPADAGLALGNHWLRENGEIAVWADGRATLPRALPPGDSCEIALSIQAPAGEGRYSVEFDLVEEGVTWFKDRGASVAFMAVTVRQRPKVIRVLGALGRALR